MADVQALKLQTKERLYETYRTEKLMAKQSHVR
jgi:septin family protein